MRKSGILMHISSLPSPGGIGSLVGEINFPGHANGIEYVPFDGYTAVLHRGERIQTAAEASLQRQLGILQRPGTDYGAIGAAMWNNAPDLGGNVYLDGRTVGKILSGMQGEQYRTMKRSGFRQ